MRFLLANEDSIGERRNEIHFVSRRHESQGWTSDSEMALQDVLPVSADNCTGVAYGLLAQPVRRALAHIEVFRCLLGFFSGKPLVQPGVDCRAEQ